MSVHTADSQFSFKLPSLSYIDARWEEPSLRAKASSPANATRNSGVAAWLSRLVATVHAWRLDNEAANELALMSDRDLQDIGLSRADVGRVFDGAFNEDLRQRGVRA